MSNLTFDLPFDERYSFNGEYYVGRFARHVKSIRLGATHFTTRMVPGSHFGNFMLRVDDVIIPFKNPFDFTLFPTDIVRVNFYDYMDELKTLQEDEARQWFEAALTNAIKALYVRKEYDSGAIVKVFLHPPGPVMETFYPAHRGRTEIDSVIEEKRVEYQSATSFSSGSGDEYCESDID